MHTGQNYDYELNQVFFDELQIRKPDIFLEAAGASTAETIGQVIAKIDVVLDQQKPEAVLILVIPTARLPRLPPSAENSYFPHGGRKPFFRPACS